MLEFAAKGHSFCDVASGGKAKIYYGTSHEGFFVCCFCMNYCRMKMS